MPDSGPRKITYARVGLVWADGQWNAQAYRERWDGTAAKTEVSVDYDGSGPTVEIALAAMADQMYGSNLELEQQLEDLRAELATTQNQLAEERTRHV